MKKSISMAASLALLTGLLGGPVEAGQGEVINIDGSSTVYPITEAMAEEFQIKTKGKTKVTVGISGTGGGFKKFCRGEIDISDASRPIKAKEMKLCHEAGIEYIELPVAFDALTVMVNPKNNWVQSIKVSELKKIWEPAAQGTVTKWNQVNPKWPNQPITLYGPGVDSGTYDYFATAIVGKKQGTRGDFTASEDDNVLVQGIANDKNALGFFGYSYYTENKDKLKAAKVDYEKGTGGVSPSMQTVLDGSYQPLSRPIFIYVRKDSLNKKYVRDFVDFYMNNWELVTEVGYVPLPKRAYKKNLQRIKDKKVGTVFGGKSEVGVTIDEMMNRLPKA